MKQKNEKATVPPGAREIERKPRETVRVVIDGMTFSARMKRCNKPNCRACPHGPYWARIIRRGGREVERYIGKELVPWLARRWVLEVLKDWEQDELPGMPEAETRFPPDRPAWLPLEIWGALRGIRKGSVMTQERIREILSA